MPNKDVFSQLNKLVNLDSPSLKNNQKTYKSNFVTAYSEDYFYSIDFRRHIKPMPSRYSYLKDRMLEEMVDNPWGYLSIQPGVRAMRDGQTKEIYDELREKWDLTLLHNCYQEVKDIPIYEMNYAQRSVYTFYRDLYDEHDLDPMRDEIDANIKNISFDPLVDDIDKDKKEEAYNNICEVLLKEPLLFNELPVRMRVITAPDSEFYSYFSNYKFDLNDIVKEINERKEKGEDLSRRDNVYLDMNAFIQDFLDNSYYYDKMMLDMKEENELYQNENYYEDITLDEVENFSEQIPMEYYENLVMNQEFETLSINPDEGQYYYDDEDEFIPATMDFDSGEIDVDEMYSKYIQEKMEDLDMFYDDSVLDKYDKAKASSMVLSDDEHFNDLIISFEEGQFNNDSELKNLVTDIAKSVGKNPELYSLVPFEIINDGDEKTNIFFKKVKRELSKNQNIPDYLLSNDIIKYDKTQIENKKANEKKIERKAENELHSR